MPTLCLTHLGPPRIAVIGPSHLVPWSTLGGVHAGKDDKECNNKPIFPSAPHRPVFCADKPVFLILPCSHALRVSHIHPYYSGGTRNSIMAPVSGRLPAGKVKTRVQPTDAATNVQHLHYPTHKCSLQTARGVDSAQREMRTCVWSGAFYGES
ncbi:hypothetical protein F4604DRAFT_1761789 [Suillus subluteus]|nr:hypothetical protein F4604DRAFT_1761789 [Suillus subluteus]